MESMQQRAHSLKQKIQSLAVEIQPNSANQETFTNFPSSFVSKVFDPSSNALHLGRIYVPAVTTSAASATTSSSSSRVTKVLLDYSSFQSLHNLFINP